MEAKSTSPCKILSKYDIQDMVFGARCNIYICLSVTEVHWHIIANLGFKFRSHFTAHCGSRAACVRIISRHASQCYRRSCFSVLKRATIRNIGFSNFWSPIGLKRLMCIAIQISSNRQRLLRYSNLSYFSRWRPSAIFDLCGKFWDDPQREFGVFITVQNLGGIELDV